MWSRTVQAHASCRCRRCVSPLNSIIRRTTTAAPKRKVSAADIFTACYTTILGSAALLDATSKEGRRKELDQKLEKARAALRDASAQRELLADQNEQRILSRRNTETQKQSLEELLRESASFFDILHSTQNVVNWQLLEAAIVREERDRLAVLREPVSSLQIDRTTQATLNLISQLLCQVQKPSNSLSADDDLRYTSDLRAAKGILGELDEIRRVGDHPSYWPPGLNENACHSVRKLLSDSIRSILAQPTGPVEMVGKICFNLLTSAAPPSMHTYNTLIVGFHRIQRPDLAQSVIDSYLDHTAWPATQQTIVCLLQHYRHNKDLIGFRDTVRRMRGYAGTGLHYRIYHRLPNTEITDSMRAKGKMWASRSHSFVQMARRSSEVFESLIQGWLSFGKTGTAVMAFIASLRSGMVVSLDTLHQLLSSCLADVDSQSARKLVIGINQHFYQFLHVLNALNHHPAKTSIELIQKMSHVLDFASFRISEMLGVNGTSYRRANETLGLIAKRIRVELELRQLTDINHAITDQLTAITHDSMANAIRICATQVKSLSENRTATAKTIARRLDLIALDNRFHLFEARLQQLSSPCIAAILSRQGLLQIEPLWLFEPGQLKDLEQRQERSALFKALSNINVEALPKTANDVKIQLVRGIPDAKMATRLERIMNLSGRWDLLDQEVLISFYRPAAVSGRMSCQPASQPSSSSKIKALERRIAKREEYIKLNLFFHLDAKKQLSLRRLHPKWHQMPLEALYQGYSQKRAEDTAIELIESEGSGAIRTQIDELKPGLISSMAALRGLGDVKVSPEHRLPLKTMDRGSAGPPPSHNARPAGLKQAPLPNSDDIYLRGKAAMS